MSALALGGYISVKSVPVVTGEKNDMIHWVQWLQECVGMKARVCCCKLGECSQQSMLQKGTSPLIQQWQWWKKATNSQKEDSRSNPASNIAACSIKIKAASSKKCLCLTIRYACCGGAGQGKGIPSKVNVKNQASQEMGSLRAFMSELLSAFAVFTCMCVSHCCCCFVQLFYFYRGSSNLQKKKMMCHH